MNRYTELLHGENFSLLKNNPLLAGLTDDEITAFIRHAKPDYYEMEPEQTITIVPGAKRKLGLVFAGNITVYTVDYSGSKTVLNVLINHGALGGLQFMVNQYNMLYEIVSADAARILMFDPEMLTVIRPDVVQIQHKILVNIMRSQRQLFLRLSDHLVCLSQKTIRDKLLRYLQIKSEAAHAYEFDLSLSREDLAAYLAVDRASLSRSLGELRREGVIDFKKNHFKILDSRFFHYE